MGWSSNAAYQRARRPDLRFSEAVALAKVLAVPLPEFLTALAEEMEAMGVTHQPPQMRHPGNPTIYLHSPSRTHPANITEASKATEAPPALPEHPRSNGEGTE